MTKPKWTPGPWQIGADYLDDDGHREIAIQASNGAGGVCTPASVVLQFPQVEGMQDANAHLIAAAPDLYEALRRLLIDMGEGGRGGRALDLLPRRTVALATAACEKACGR